MGLCKCRVVSQLFCFQCKETVCDNCLSEHPTCVVKTYLQWLQDNEYDANCIVCKEPVTNGEQPIRLICYDVMHWSCLQTYVKSAFPEHTAPAGYTCPRCQEPFIPRSNDMSSIAVESRKLLATTSWGKNSNDSAAALQSDSQWDSQSPGSTDTVEVVAANASSVAATPLGTARGAASTIVSRKPVSKPEDSAIDIPDADNDKYARRPANEWFTRLVENRVPARPTVKSSTDGLKRAAVALLLAVILLITLVEALTRARPNGNSDPLLDPAQNPNIRVDDNLAHAMNL